MFKYTLKKYNPEIKMEIIICNKYCKKKVKMLRILGRVEIVYICS